MMHWNASSAVILRGGAGVRICWSFNGRGVFKQLSSVFISDKVKAVLKDSSDGICIWRDGHWSARIPGTWSSQTRWSRPLLHHHQDVTSKTNTKAILTVYAEGKSHWQARVGPGNKGGGGNTGAEQAGNKIATQALSRGKRALSSNSSIIWEQAMLQLRALLTSNSAWAVGKQTSLNIELGSPFLGH